MIELLVLTLQLVEPVVSTCLIVRRLIEQVLVRQVLGLRHSKHVIAQRHPSVAHEHIVQLVAIDLVERAEISSEAALFHRAVDHWVQGVYVNANEKVVTLDIIPHTHSRKFHSP